VLDLVVTSCSFSYRDSAVEGNVYYLKYGKRWGRI